MKKLLFLLMIPSICFGMPDIAPPVNQNLKQIIPISSKKIDDYAKLNNTVCFHQYRIMSKKPYDVYECVDGHTFKEVIWTQ